MEQSNYLFVFLHIKRKKVLKLSVFTWFIILDKSKMTAKMATMFGDDTDLQQRHHP